MMENPVEENDRLLRLFERQLDSYHMSFPLMRRPPSAALYAVMAAYDSMLLPLRELTSRIDDKAIGLRQDMRAIVQSINPALLWITCEGQALRPEPAGDIDLIDEGGNFLTHARKYFHLSTFHSMYSRGLTSVECDEKEKTVRFVRPKPDSFPDGFASAVVARRSNQLEERTEQIAIAFNKWLATASYRLNNGRIVLLKPMELISKEVDDVARLFAIPEMLELPDDTDVVGFTMGDFRRFWLGLHCWSIAASELYLALIVSGVAQERCMPTQIVPFRVFFESMIALTGLTAQVIDNITHRLMYDTADVKRDVFLQPLLRGPDSISWCPLWINQSRPERNMLKLMSRSRTLANVAATIIGGREQHMLNELGLLLAKRGGYDFKLNSRLRGKGGASELDLLAYNRRVPSEVLLVEAKAVLAVDDVAEVQAATEQLRKAKLQLERSVDILISMPEIQKRLRFPFVDWRQVRTYRPLIVTPDSSPLPEFDHDLAAVITLELLQMKFKNKDFKSPTAIWEACRRKEWLDVFKLGGEDFYGSLTVGSVTYEFPARAEPPRDSNTLDTN